MVTVGLNNYIQENLKQKKKKNNKEKHLIDICVCEQGKEQPPIHLIKVPKRGMIHSLHLQF